MLLATGRLRLTPTRPRGSGLLSTAACLLPCPPPRHPPLVLPSWSQPLIPDSERSVPAAGDGARESSLVAAAPGGPGLSLAGLRLRLALLLLCVRQVPGDSTQMLRGPEA